MFDLENILYMRFFFALLSSFCSSFFIHSTNILYFFTTSANSSSLIDVISLIVVPESEEKVISAVKLPYSYRFCSLLIDISIANVDTPLIQNLLHKNSPITSANSSSLIDVISLIVVPESEEKV